MSRSIWCAVIVLAVVAVPCAAAERGFYVGAGFGVSSYDVRDFNEEYADLRFEEDQFGLKLFGGYRFLGYLGVEAGYVDYGTVTRHEVSILRESEELRVAIDSWDASIVGFLSLGKKVDLFGKVGAASWNADVRVTVDGDSDEDNRSGTDLTYGLGIDFRFKKLGMRFEGDWLEIPDTGGAFLLSLNLTYSF
jgi:hypothetical protein